MNPQNEKVELFAAYSVEEIQVREEAMATSGYFRGEYCSGSLID